MQSVTRTMTPKVKPTLDLGLNTGAFIKDFFLSFSSHF